MRREERREKIADYIERFTAENRYPPTVRDIQKKFGVKSTSTVYSDLKALVEDHRLERVGSHFVPFYTESYLKAISRVCRPI